MSSRKSRRSAPPVDDHICVQKEIRVVALSDGPMKGWVHTIGMSKHGKPELEIRNVPLFLVGPAFGLLNMIADYVLNGGRPVVVGDTLQLCEDGPSMRFVASEPTGFTDADAIINAVPHWRLDDSPAEGHCDAHCDCHHDKN